MKKNIGNTDKIIRFVIAIVAVWAAYTEVVPNPWNYVLYAVAIIMVLTALISTCPIWLVTGINTLKSKNK
ncbi:MAG: DUF2892 domain-containing protein [Flavobacteriaceae bacterium]|nr:DUF2892 domain-containing protein [Flavobacteriaceae bacterium]